MRKKLPDIWTFGHSNRSIEELLEVLDANGIKAVADVRRFPGSRRHPQFGQAQLCASLAKSGIDYAHFEELGGRRKPRPDSVNVAWRTAAFRGYADYMVSTEFRAGIAKLLEFARIKSTAIMCAEALWWQCHRGLISDYLKVQGYRVIHIFSSGKTEDHPFTPAARIVDGKLSYSVAETEEQLTL
jgi:uncharacterized protein (DUF488 family)